MTTVDNLETPLIGSNFARDDSLHHRKLSYIRRMFRYAKLIYYISEAEAISKFPKPPSNGLKESLEYVDKAYKYAMEYPYEHGKLFPLIFCVRGDIKRLMGDFEGGLEDLNKAYELAPKKKFVLKTRGHIKTLMGDYIGALKDLDKANDNVPNDSFTLKVRGDVKRRMNDYVGALVDLDKANELVPNDNFTLQIRGSVKANLNDVKGALADLNEAKKLKPNVDIFTLKHRKFSSK